MNPTPIFDSIFSSLALPHPRLEACVIIPARDEGCGLIPTLDSFLEQRDAQGRPLDPARFEILLLANNCRDQTAQIARAWSRNHPSIALFVTEKHFKLAEAGAGTARRLLMDAASARLLQLPAATSQKPRAICSTDADTLVSPFWIVHTLEAMRRGALAVGGRIFLRRDIEVLGETEAQTDVMRRTYRLDTAYHLLRVRLEARLDPQCGDPYPRHFQFFGASLAIRPETYAQIGGLPLVRVLEDVALERRLESLDLAVRHCPQVTVSTSARRCGRVETGLSTQLEEWSELEHDAPWLVPSGDEIAFKTGLQRRLRACWVAPDRFKTTSQNSRQTAELAAIARRSPLKFGEQIEAAPYFGGLWQGFWSDVQRNPAFHARFAPVPVECALQQMRCLLQSRREKHQEAV